MADASETLVFGATKDAVDALRAAIDAQPGSHTQVSERKNLDGDAGMWIAIATLAVKALPHVLGFLKEYLKGNPDKVRRIKVGDVVIENPTAEDIDRLTATIASRS